MKIRNIIILLLFQLVFVPQILFAQYLDEGFGFEKVMLMRTDIQNRLRLSDEQEMIRSMIDAKYHPKFNSKFSEIGKKVSELQTLADSENCSKEEVDKIVEELKVKEDELFEINKLYEDSIKTILTPCQKMKYSVLKHRSRTKLKRELRNQIKAIKFVK